MNSHCLADLDVLSERQRTFFIDGLSCSSCVNTIERSAERIPGIKRLRIDFGRSLLNVELSSGGRFSHLEYELERMGYRIRPLKADPLDTLRLSNRRDLLKIGLAAAASGNIMLLTVAIYAGASGTTALSLGWISLALATPVMAYSAIPFYQTTWIALKQKKISIDLPIVLALFAGFGVSLYNLLKQSASVYTDSLTMLVFLLLSSRFFLKRMQQKVFSARELLHFFTHSTVKKLESDGSIKTIPIEKIVPEDSLLVLAGEQIPVDGIIQKHTSYVDMSLLTGESEPIKVISGETVYAGTQNLTANIEIKATQPWNKSRLSRILEQINSASQEKGRFVSISDKLGKVFTYLVTAWALGLIIFFRHTPAEGFYRALAVLIVACPCVFAFAIPLVNSFAIALAAKKGALIKNGDVLERLNQIKNVFLDKTGTLTEGRFFLENFLVYEGDERELKQICYALETQSRHPLALALQRDLFVGSQKNLFLEDWKEKISEGVFARYQGSEWSITTDHQAQVDQGSVSLSLKKNGKQVARLKLRDRIRSDSHWATRKLKDWGLKLAILSGDRRENVVAVAKELRIPFAQGQMSPEAKAQVLADYPNSLMIGDGANDGIALKRAHVGIAVHNSVEISLGAADIYVSKPGLSSILDLLLIAREAHRLIMRNLFISAFYNIIGITLASTGLMNPLWAALLMPLSATTVFASSYLSTSKLRHLNKDISANKRAAPLAEGIA